MYTVFMVILNFCLIVFFLFRLMRFALLKNTFLWRTFHVFPNLRHISTLDNERKTVKLPSDYCETLRKIVTFNYHRTCNYQCGRKMENTFWQPRRDLQQNRKENERNEEKIFYEKRKKGLQCGFQAIGFQQKCPKFNNFCRPKGHTAAEGGL